ncbi:WhiB family transcriptional regulator [Streptomyces vilmorinianum]|uniref:WhiB family transcriptional regulator n=1 Tax=Streptomyces vilmorinianum TaxID=3051092 RepID=UPI00158666E2|nr:WhiB family transcriptional regulator [Streptomyces vilmorinianum]
MRRTHAASISATPGAAAASLPCHRRPDVFRHPLLENPPVSSAELPIQGRRIQALAHAARQLCASCPLRRECLEDSVLRPDPGGYLAGTTEQDRRLIRRRLGIGTPQGDLTTPVDLRQRSADFEAELDAVLDAFAPGHTSRHLRPRPRTPVRPGPRSTVPTQKTHHVAEVSMAAPAGERITFALDDPVLAVQQAVLTPLLLAALPALEASERLAGMLAHAPSAGLAPELAESCRRARLGLEAWRAEQPEDASRIPADTGLVGSVSVELATSDPITALRQDLFEPLLRRVADSIVRIEEVMSVLMTGPDGGIDADTGMDPNADRTKGGASGRAMLADLRAALRELAAHIEAYEAVAPAAGFPASGGPGRPGAPDTGGAVVRALHPSTSLRQAVDRAVASLPGPFTARDVLIALPPEVFQESAKSISNILSAMVKSARLRRVSRGTYTLDPTESPVVPFARDDLAEHS